MPFARTVMCICLVASALAAWADEANFVLVHGAWHGGWAWQPVAQRLRSAGHHVTTPTLTGLGERSHLVEADTDLATHVEDLVLHLRMDDLTNVILVGHSYSGMVVSGVLARSADRVGKAVYLDALVPEAGESLADIAGDAATERWELLLEKGEMIPPPPADTWGHRWGLVDPTLKAWVGERITAQPPATFLQRVQGSPWSGSVGYFYIRCAGNPNPVFAAMADKVRNNDRWRYIELDSHHDAMLLSPVVLTRVLLDIAREHGGQEVGQ